MVSLPTNRASHTKERRNNQITYAASDKVKANVKIWAVRIALLLGISIASIYRIQQAWNMWDSYTIYAILMPIYTLAALSIRTKIFVTAWTLYKNPACGGSVGTDLVSVIIPVYNQNDLIKNVIEAIYESTYKNIEVIVVNDGSNDGTKDILDNIAKKYHNLKIIHKKREGKRNAIATGFYASTGKYIISQDSDCIIDNNAISEFMKAFRANPNTGSLTGQIKIWNTKNNNYEHNNFLNNLQDSNAGTSCNIHKASESSFKSVLCSSGAISAFRRDAISDLMHYWSNTNTYGGGSIDREMSSHSLRSWESYYVSSAIVYDAMQPTLKRYIKQQIRWRIGFLRSNINNLRNTSFQGRKNVITSLLYHCNFIAGLSMPLITLTVLFYEPFVLRNFYLPLAYVMILLLWGLVSGLDMKFREPNRKSWKYQPFMALFSNFVLSWLLFPALWNYKKNSWLTR